VGREGPTACAMARPVFEVTFLNVIILHSFYLHTGFHEISSCRRKDNIYKEPKEYVMQWILTLKSSGDIFVCKTKFEV
jgi:hypothetical protein